MLIPKRLFAFLVLFLALTISAHGQQQRGFVSIDCGGPENFEYTDGTIKYNTDGAYINTGVNRSISSEYNYPKNPTLPQPLSDLRSFPEGKRNCYNIKTPIRNSLHLIRASFLYGNYDGENKLPEFDLYVDVNFWSSVTFRNASEQLIMEIISLKVSEEINVCLVNKGSGIPFISALELRPIIYGHIYRTEFGSYASLLLFKRWDIASLNGSGRYEDDVYDRIWSPYSSSSWETLETSSAINGSNSGYNAPFEVIRTAARPKNEGAPLEFSWKSNDPNSKFYVYLYFAEVEKLQKKELRKFNISWNGSPLFGPFVPSYLNATIVSNLKSLVGNEHQISISRTDDSTLPPILNAVEIYVVRQIDAKQTFEQDVEAMMNVKGTYGVQRNWVGDPCEPKDYSWDGLECNYSNSLPPRIISLNLSSSSLSGGIASEISNLLLLESLDLSNNSLTGSIPQFLEDFKSLKVLNLKGNHLSGSVPDNLLERSRAGLLTLSVDDQNICGLSTCKKKKNIAVPIAVSILSVLVLLIAFALIWKLRKKKPSDKEIEKANKGGRSTIASKKWQYSYEEILEITNNFKMAIGKGGFGIVYRGELKDWNQVAVKMLSPSSSQGTKEFQTEAELLMTVHHRNLVSFIGYCDDDNKMALIYEYMANGNLKNYLRDKNSNSLTWQRRLEIAIDSAQGLEYLHHGCKPPIIHRDVKTANILLNENLEAKIADFGLSKVFKNDNTNVNAESEVMGTTGYLDPEYYKLRKLNEKSDIYSFGVVILELITGQPAVIKGEELVHITVWVANELEERGDLSRIVDPKLAGKFNAASVEKALGIAMACSASPSIHRPTLNFVVQELKQCLEMECPSHSDRFEMLPRQVYSEIYSSSEPYSYDTDSITSPFAR